MAFPLTLPAIGSISWGTAVNANWTTLNNAFQTQANFTGTTSASSSITGSLIVGNGTAATSVGIGGGNLYLGGLLSGQNAIFSGTDTTTTSLLSPLGINITLTAAPASASTATYDGVISEAFSNNTNTSAAAVNALAGVAGISSSQNSTLGTTIGVVGETQCINNGASGVSTTISAAYGVYIQALVTATNAGATSTITTYYGLYVASPSFTGSGTKSITNIYGIYQADTNATNFFAGRSLGFFNRTPSTQSTGYGTPTGNVKTTSFPGATATLIQTSEMLAQLLLDLKTLGLIGA